LFSLGVVLYLATTGERPFDGATAMAVMRNLELHLPGRVNVKRVDVPPAFSNLIMELLAKERRDRPASAEIVAARLGRPEITRPSHLPVAPPPIPTGPPIPAVPRSPGWESPARDHPPGTSIMRVLFMIAAASILFGFYWYFYVSNYGKLVVESQTFDSEIVVRQNGERRRKLTLQDREVDLRPGTYDLTLTRPKTGFKLTRTTINISRGGREMVGIIPDGPGR
jgi:serine/threonine protein kinase